MRKAFAFGVMALVVLPSFALADGDGAIKGGAGGAIAGAVVGGPVGAAVGGAAGAVVGGVVTGPGQPVVVQPMPPEAPCNTRTTQTTDNTGYSKTTQTTDCQN